MLPIGLQIYLRRQERGLSQRELAVKAGLPQPNLSNIEKGKQDLTLTTLRKIAYALGVPLGEFFEAEGPGKNKSFPLSRRVIERLARAIARRDISLSPKEKQVAELFSHILPGKSKHQVRQKKMHQSWLELKKCFRPAEINALYERIQELQRGNDETTPD